MREGTGDKVLDAAPSMLSSSSGESYACSSASLSGVPGADGDEGERNECSEWVGSMGEGGDTMVAGGWRVSEGARVDAAPDGWAEACCWEVDVGESDGEGNRDEDDGMLGQLS